jgi:hypothetical protein
MSDKERPFNYVPFEAEEKLHKKGGEGKEYHLCFPEAVVSEVFIVKKEEIHSPFLSKLFEGIKKEDYASFFEKKNGEGIMNSHKVFVSVEDAREIYKCLESSRISP